MNEEITDKMIRKELTIEQGIEDLLNDLLKNTDKDGWLTTEDWCGFSIDEAYKPNVDCKIKSTSEMTKTIAKKVNSINNAINILAVEESDYLKNGGNKQDRENAKKDFFSFVKGSNYLRWFDCCINSLKIKANFEDIIYERLRRIGKLYEIGCPEIIMINELFNLAQSILVNEYAETIKIYYPNEYHGEECDALENTDNKLL